MESLKDRPLVKVTLAVLPSSLFESSSLGYGKRTFTGAFANRIGPFSLADGHTLLLDIVGEPDSNCKGNC